MFTNSNAGDPRKPPHKDMRGSKRMIDSDLKNKVHFKVLSDENQKIKQLAACMQVSVNKTGYFSTLHARSNAWTDENFSQYKSFSMHCT